MSIQATERVLKISPLCQAIVDFLPRHDQDRSKEVSTLFKRNIVTLQDRLFSKGERVLRNRGLCHTILSFGSTLDQDRCKRVCRPARKSAEAIQRRDILARLSPEVINCLGQARLENTPIFNLHGMVLLNREHIPAPFIVGLASNPLTGQSHVLAAAKINFMIPGRGCLRRCFSLTVMQGFFLGDLSENPSIVVARKFADLLDGKKIDSRLPYGGNELERTCCRSTRIFARFRHCFFRSTQSFDESDCKIKLDRS